MMEHTGRCVAVSEPNSPTVLAEKIMKFGDSSELRQLARDVIRWECRPYPSMQPPLSEVGAIWHCYSSSVQATPVVLLLF